MQYHLNGFHPRNPDIAEPVDDAGNRSPTVDVLIIGCGPAGLTLAAQLSAFPHVTTRITEQLPGPLQIGRADGVACRSMEMFEAFGFAEKVAREAYRVNETTFWRPSADNEGIVRADRIQDVEDDLSEMPHVILSQARVHDFYLDVMKNSPHRLAPDYNHRLKDLVMTDDPVYPLTATFDCLEEGQQGQTDRIRARYVVGCDGARSAVREWLGYTLQGEAARQLWGVMDVLPITDFPDIRLKSAIQSATEGSLLLIPREGGYMVRMYIELDELHGSERAADRQVTSEILLAKANAILYPYTLELREVAWCSAYEIGQRLCDTFDDVPEHERETRSPRVFIAGDACHTHSPKAGQGMNVSMADTFNLGWKLASVIAGRADPKLLHTYSLERYAKAKELIDFDRDMAKLFSARSGEGAVSEEFERYFKKHGRYTAGVETRYGPSLIVMPDTHQQLAAGLTIGMRFHSAPVIRLADAAPMQLGHILKADGRWRLIAFASANDSRLPDGDVAALCAFLQHDLLSPIRRYTPQEADIDAIIDVRAVFQQGHRDLAVDKMPPLLLPSKGRYGLIDYEKVFCPDLKSGQDIFDMRGIDRRTGALVIVRPDQYVAGILPLHARESLIDFFSGFMIEAKR
ncbi:MAG TPA: FAD-dependent monooxygenase [Ktedonobacterales bacterium]|nr:FAD-dependent monooxygenase [Ktedonobacterales bacterium]